MRPHRETQISMLRRPHLAPLLGILTAAITVDCAPAHPSPNVLLITVDTLRADHSSAYGYPRDTTPVLDALANEGARFEAAYAPMSLTAPVHASLFSGLYPATHLLLDNGLEMTGDYVTLAELFGAGGYQTAAVVSSFVLDAKFGFARGFAHYEDDFEADTATSLIPEWMGHKVPKAFDRRADATTDRAIQWLEERRDSERPFFLFLHYFDPHAPYLPPGRFALRYSDGTTHNEHQIDLYDGEIAFTDFEIGRFLAALSAAGLDRNTIVALTADHGESLMQRDYWTHGLFIYEEEVRVPLVLRWPGHIPAGRVHREPVELIDLAPTLVELTALDRDTAVFEGRSLAQALQGDAPLDPDRPVFLARKYYKGGLVQGDIPAIGRRFGVRRGIWKYIVGPEEGTHELYNLELDPGETVDLYAEKPKRARKLAKVLERWRSTHAQRRSNATIPAEDREALRALGYTN